jgi:ArsR family transcriptional regulator, arsenate/arsenite/antimonite-responsive transcriptional repressor
MDDESHMTHDEDLSRVAKALGHPIRVRIVRLLLARDTCVCGEIVSELPVSQATVSQHLKVLKEAGLVRGEIDGPRVCYCADREALAAHVASLAALAGAHVNGELEVVR